MSAKRHNPADIIFTWAGLNFEGYAADNFISIVRTTPANSSSAGANGEVTIEGSNDKRKQITLRLQRTSKDNAALSTIFQAQELSRKVFAAPLTIKDGLGADLHVSPEAWIMTEPDPEYGLETGELEWIFEVKTMKSFNGGS